MKFDISNTTNVICLAAYRALTGQQLQPLRVVQPTMATIHRFEKAWMEKNNRR